MKYAVTITAVGSLARNFLENNNSVIILDEGIRPNLADMVVQHTEGQLTKDIKAGDTLTVGDLAFKVVRVGEIANQTIRTEGHCTLVFNTEGTMPGQIIVQGPVLPRLKAGDMITFV